MTKTEKILLVRGLIRAFYTIRARYVRSVVVTLNGCPYRADVDGFDGSTSVWTEEGLWLGWVNANGEAQSMGGIDPSLRPLVCAVAELVAA